MSHKILCKGEKTDKELYKEYKNIQWFGDITGGEEGRMKAIREYLGSDFELHEIIYELESAVEDLQEDMKEVKKNRKFFRHW